MLRNLVCDHELEAFVQITTLSSSDYRGQSTAPQLHKDATTISGSYFQNNTGTHNHAFKYQKKKEKRKAKYTSTIKTNNGKIAFFGQGQPVHLITCSP